MLDIEEFKLNNPYLQTSREQSTASTRVQNARDKVNNTTTYYQSAIVEYENLKREIASSEKTIQNSDLKENLQVDLMKLQGKAHSSYKVKMDSEKHLVDLQISLADMTKQQITFSKLILDADITEDKIRTLSASIDNTRHLLANPKGSIEVYRLADKGTPLLEGTLLGDIQRCFSFWKN